MAGRKKIEPEAPKFAWPDMRLPAPVKTIQGDSISAEETNRLLALLGDGKKSGGLKKG